MATESPKKSGQNEDDLRKSLRQALQSLNRREPLDPNYKRLILNGTVTTRRPVLVKDKFYRRVGSRLRERVEGFLAVTEGKDPYDRIAQRQPLEEEKMRAALTLREAKEHEQTGLLEATLAAIPARNGMDETERKKHFEGIAMTLQAEKKKTHHHHHHHHRTTNTSGSKSPTSAAEKTEAARQNADLERQRAQARAREAARRRREEEERQRAQEELARKRKAAETPEQALHKLYSPIFKKLWDMEFVNLNSTNPFRIVIDRANCAAMGAPDYFDVINTPMNLTYIQQKVNKMEYKTLKEFFADVDLMVSNAVLYNSDPHNPYRIAAEEMKKRYLKMAKKVLQTLQQKQK
ncbi:adjacent to zinc finger domain protein 1A [Seminavis robusta]|uniref:Adjacent to zinc finger domain protein 1A n=1 Tax=Seminavis robusta TaxID=568900 RepID=A0A9N8H6G3_9STRA|nr:adjacent to zinc finger domain protein 1A [Seminavis robusta]|eukprot:Sro170_g075460.1 adjacent to zinc finger domain protein 1A (349) ;mRNA; r:57455-58610